MANVIHPTAILEGNIQLGDNNEIGPYCVLRGPLKVGDSNLIGPHVAIGTPGQDTRNPRYDSSNCAIEIGSHNIIREFTAIQKPCYRDLTSIGDHVYLMQSVHIPHDAILQDKVVVTPMVVCGGIVRILKGANLAIGASVHQYTVVGHYAIVGMGAPLSKNLRPFSKYVPRSPVSVNEYAISKHGFDTYREEITEYVLHNVRPRSDALLELIDEFETFSRNSGRDIL
jgi:UDP-N-acetylglucosamine acyltransferase